MISRTLSRNRPMTVARCAGNVPPRAVPAVLCGHVCSRAVPATRHGVSRWPLRLFIQAHAFVTISGMPPLTRTLVARRCGRSISVPFFAGRGAGSRKEAGPPRAAFPVASMSICFSIAMKDHARKFGMDGIQFLKIINSDSGHFNYLNKPDGIHTGNLDMWMVSKSLISITKMVFVY